MTFGRIGTDGRTRAYAFDGEARPDLHGSLPAPPAIITETDQRALRRATERGR
jgi:hypothetical protein